VNFEQMPDSADCWTWPRPCILWPC